MLSISSVLHIRIQASEVLDSAVDFPHTGCCGGVQNLAMKVGYFDCIAVNETDGLESGPGEIGSGGTA